MPFVKLKKFPFIPSLHHEKVLLHVVHWISCISLDDHVAFVLHSINVLYDSDRFLYIEPTLHSWKNMVSDQSGLQRLLGWHIGDARPH